METPAKGYFDFKNSYGSLPERFFERIHPVPVKDPELLFLNEALVADLNLDADRIRQQDCIELLAGNRTTSDMQPLAMAYAGHQFGHFVPQLGDGRAILLGELLDTRGVLQDVQLKGSGVTRFSRRGDGRAPLGAVVREYVISEALHFLGIPTTRSLAILATGESVARQQITPGGILVRTAASHIRVGTFEYFAAQRDTEAIEVLANYTIKRHYPDLEQSEQPAFELLECVAKRQAQLIADWMQVGFIHGVMNTDNMTLSGESIDFGPCAFMDGFNPETVFSSIDQHGRYSFSNQPLVARWNLARLAEALLPLIHPDSKEAIAQATTVIDGFLPLFHGYWLDGMLEKIGVSEKKDGDEELLEELLQLMHQYDADYTLSFFELAELLTKERCTTTYVDALFQSSEFRDWRLRWTEQLTSGDADFAATAARMRSKNPTYIARNHQVQAVIEAAEQGNISPLESFVEVLKAPFAESKVDETYLRPPEENERVIETFCGT